METITSKLNTVKEALIGVTDQVWHYHAMKNQAPYIVWAEELESGNLHGDNEKRNQVIQGTIDLYTSQDLDPLIDVVQDRLRQAKISFKLNSVQYEEETGYIHYEWVWEVE